MAAIAVWLEYVTSVIKADVATSRGIKIQAINLK
jgi:hypothetical protein